MSPIVELLTLVSACVSSLIMATWILSNKIASIKSHLAVQLQELKTDLAVMKKSEEGRDEKINRMWEWWMRSLEKGWAAHMESRPREQ